MTVSYLSNRPTLSSWSRKDTAVHVSLSSDSNVKQRIIRLSFRSRQKQVSSRLTSLDLNARRSSRNTGSRRPHRAASPSVGAVYAGGPDLSTGFPKKLAPSSKLPEFRGLRPCGKARHLPERRDLSPSGRREPHLGHLHRANLRSSGCVDARPRRSHLVRPVRRSSHLS